MNREYPLPVEFADLSNRVRYVQRKSNNEYTGTCPQCGGEPHQHGDLPDRFCMWRVGKHGGPLGWCRKCGYIWTPKQERMPSPAELEAWRKEQEAYHLREKEKHERALEALKSERIWEAYHAMLDERVRGILEDRGIYPGWQDFWKLGYSESFTVWYKGNDTWENYTSPALSIPVWQANGAIANVKMRVMEPRADHHRYRNIYKTGSAYLFVARYDIPMKNKLFVAEGEFKAMNVAQWLRGDWQVVGLPSVSPDPALFDSLRDFDEIVVCLDPDAYRVGKQGVEPRINAVVRELGGSRVRVLRLPMKVDDAIIQADLDINKLVLQAKRLTQAQR